MEFHRLDLFRGEIFVFTPCGDVKALPKGATPSISPISVLTELGQQCAGAKVNGRIVPLAPELTNGDAA
jgi:GTP pyrophosphokinase